jgi:PhzF family phenazine biosynthesis protein
MWVFVKTSGFCVDTNSSNAPEPRRTAAQQLKGNPMALELPIYQVDAFADALFGGNPAAVVPMREWRPDALLQKIAAENNLAETAFLVADGDSYALRWFTPVAEVPLCGHATLASAYVVFEFLQPGRRRVTFTTMRAGPLHVSQSGALLELDFPAKPPEPVATPDGLVEALGARPTTLLANGKLFAVFDTAEAVKALAPDFRKLAGLDFDGLVATAPGADGIDFVSRYFAPHLGIDEDPVTGSAHCLLVPYWAKILGKSKVTGRQISARGGTVHGEDRGGRVGLSGGARLYLEGRIFLP